LQLAAATAAIANGGALYRPHVVAHIDNPRTGERESIAPQLLRQIPLKPEHVAFVQEAMAGVNQEGTGARAFAGAEYTSAGKTGTAQVIGIKQNEKYDESKVDERLRDHSLFIAFAPLQSPKIALAVVVENGGFGSRTAAPIARTVLDYYLLGKRTEASVQESDDADMESP